MTDSVENPPDRLVSFIRSPGCWLLLLFGPWACFLLVLLVLFRDPLFPQQVEPTQLPPLPAPAVAIVGVDVVGFYYSPLYVQASDGQVYRLLDDETGWEAELPAETLDEGQSCDRRTQRSLREINETIVVCRTMPMGGEWCPPPSISYAIMADGELWKLVRQNSCAFPASYLCQLGSPVLLGIGLLLVGFRALLLRYGRRATSS